jgi:integrase
MATRAIERLSIRTVQTARPKGKVTRGPTKGQPRTTAMLCDGGGLYLQVTIGDDGNIRRSWIFRYQRPGRPKRDMGLGSLNTIGLADARAKARECRQALLAGKDPRVERDAERSRNLAAATAVQTFDQAAASYIAAHRHAWGNPVHAAQWESSLAMHVSSTIGKMSVADIDTEHVLKVLRPIWLTQTVTAKRVRNRIELVLGAATAAGLRKDENGRDKDNPARWRGHLETQLAKPSKVHRPRPQPCLPFEEMPTFMHALRQRRGIVALALEFLILTSVRSADVLKAKRAHINRAEARWDIPEFSKTKRLHRVPLSKAALAVLDKVEAIVNGIGGAVGASEYLFPNDVTGAALSGNSLLAIINRMGFKNRTTAHGFRAAFRTWLQDATNYPRELGELALGHTVGDAVELAYARGDKLRQRVVSMERWANFLASRVEKSEKCARKVVDLAIG